MVLSVRRLCLLRALLPICANVVMESSQIKFALLATSVFFFFFFFLQIATDTWSAPYYCCKPIIFKDCWLMIHWKGFLNGSPWAKFRMLTFHVWPLVSFKIYRSIGRSRDANAYFAVEISFCRKISLFAFFARSVTFNGKVQNYFFSGINLLT